MNSILFWNEVAMDANKQAHTDNKDTGTLGPTLSSRAFAIVHLAMYDAYAAVRRSQGASLPEYLPGLPPVPATPNALEAAAGAAFTALVALYPSQKDFFEGKKNDAGIPKGDPGASFKYGETVANLLRAARRFDPDSSDYGYRPSLDRGRHRSDPDQPGQGFNGPYYGALSRGFAITKRHVLAVPPSVFKGQPGYDEYVAALEEVRCKGIKPELAGTLTSGDKRTPTETLIGIYWGYDGAVQLGTPPRLYNQIVREVAKKRSPGDNDAHARLFALVNAAMGDSGILAWDQKYMHDLWRPVLGIREHDLSLGPDTADDVPTNQLDPEADPGWLPLGAPNSNSVKKNGTPGFPAYPSGHATFGAAALHMTRLFYGVKPGNRKKDDLFEGLFFVSDEFNGITVDNTGTIRPRHERSFKGGLWDMILENGLSRVLLGVHWIFDAYAVKKNGDPDLDRNVGGVPLGLTIAEDIWTSGLKPSTVGPRPDFPSTFKV